MIQGVSQSPTTSDGVYFLSKVAQSFDTSCPFNRRCLSTSNLAYWVSVCASCFVVKCYRYVFIKIHKLNLGKARRFGKQRAHPETNSHRQPQQKCLPQCPHRDQSPKQKQNIPTNNPGSRYVHSIIVPFFIPSGDT